MFLGIEIGGTKLQLGVGRGDGSPLLALERRSVDSARGAAGILEQIAATGHELCQRFNVAGIGIGFGGPVRSAAGRTLTSHQIAGWDDFPLADWCRQTFGRPATLGNDCDAAALAEARFGAGRGCGIVFYVTVGTGIGGGLVIDGQLHGTSRPSAAEIGHLRPGFQAIAASQTVEALASGPAIASAARQRLGQATATTSSEHADLLARCRHDPSQLTARIVAEAADAGNSLAMRVFADATRALGWGIGQMITLLSPEVVVVGGGVSLAGERLFFEPLRAAVRQYVFPPLLDAYRIVSAALGEEVVVHGALAVAAGSRQ